MPPPAIRRPVTITTWFAVAILCLALSPLLLALGAIATRLAHRPQPLILVRLMIAYFRHELVALVGCGALWLVSGAGRDMHSRRVQLLHYRLLRWFVGGVASQMLAVLHLDVSVEQSAPAIRALESDEPLLFLSRHAGPGDTFLLLDLLLRRFDRLPSVVFKQSLTIDPFLDLIGHRLPHAVLDTSDGPGSRAQIERVSAGLGPRGVLLLFPEGGNFTHERRGQAIRKLWRTGRRREAAKAAAMSHVLPPHPAGALSALRAAPTADVIFAAHTGLGLAAFPRELWRDPPLGRTLKTHMGLVPAAHRPRDPDAQVDWIYDWWKRLDEWIEKQGDEAPAGSVLRVD
jgi:1-acyl-sn-glycerol-3-phosphate acyltransferase